MPLAGKKLMPREIAELGAAHWADLELVKQVATTLGESLGYVGAYHDNDTPPTSRDLGLMQINVPARIIGTPAEALLRTESKLAVEWKPVGVKNIEAAFHLYDEPGPNDGKRLWQPWVAYTTGWATFPAWWVWHQDAGSKPVGPWMPTGRYVHHAIVGVANYRLLIARDLKEVGALKLARDYADQFSVGGTDLMLSNGVVRWVKVPPKPTSPPKDGVGPRPRPNTGA